MCTGAQSVSPDFMFAFSLSILRCWIWILTRTILRTNDKQCRIRYEIELYRYRTVC